MGCADVVVRQDGLVRALILTGSAPGVSRCFRDERRYSATNGLHAIHGGPGEWPSMPREAGYGVALVAALADDDVVWRRRFIWRH